MYHFVGIKGAGMSSLAQMLKELGYDVQGSDLPKHFFTEKGLVECHIPFYSYNADNIHPGMTIVRGASITDDHPEIIKAKELDLPIITYEEMLGKLTRESKAVCVAGCHGKTTTTSMLSHVLGPVKGANYLVGDGTGFALKENEYFILESCEYRRHFLNYTPYYAVITNIDLDHVDYYRDIDDIVDAYESFAKKATHMVIACGDDPYTHRLQVDTPLKFYGFQEEDDIRATDVVYSENGTSFDVTIDGNAYGHFNLPLYGKHQVYDALATIAVCYYESVTAEEVQKYFSTFGGARRRFEETRAGNSVIIDDYAHHPNEVKATITAIQQKYPHHKIVAIFQPHTFSRTLEFAKDIAKVLKEVDKAYIMDIHPARESQQDFLGVTSDLIIHDLTNGAHISMEDADILYNERDAVYIFMSPNDVSKLENALIEKLK